MTTADLRSPQRSTYHHGDLALALRDLAIGMIAEHGVDSFSLRRAAAELGVAPSAIYRHYSDKSALLKAICVEGFSLLGQQWLDLMGSYVASVDSSAQSISLARFSAGADAYFRFALEQSVLFQLMYGEFGTGSADWSLEDENDPLNPFTILDDILDELRDSGLISKRARVGAEVAAYAAIHGVSALAASGAFRGKDEAQMWEQLEIVKRNLLSGLRNEDVLNAPSTVMEIDPVTLIRTLKRS
ncbi:TetR/AcrR family transcriptional regulator [Novosphingobium sp.]|uniref:TetR/AcrR family transcriptional regulator n=1 Tax=Novosphingobium sp. TaxID=1874826 RepID=UPI0025DFD0A0|nr:TetR/AcrR family transcriptional regulator [Novosphingobium sp.]